MGHALVAMALFGAMEAGCERSIDNPMVACQQEATTATREECRFQVALGLHGDRDALTEAIAQVPDLISQDLLRLRLSLHDPDAMRWLCAEATVPDVRDRCKYVLDRPHLTLPRPKE